MALLWEKKAGMTLSMLGRGLGASTGGLVLAAACAAAPAIAGEGILMAPPSHLRNDVGEYARGHWRVGGQRPHGL
jgi:hypothetical protein